MNQKRNIEEIYDDGFLNKLMQGVKQKKPDGESDAGNFYQKQNNENASDMLL